MPTPPSTRVWVTRYMRCGHGDEFGARDAMSAARAAMTAAQDMHRATTFEAGNPHPIARKKYTTMAQAADERITKVAGIDKLGPQAVRYKNWMPGSPSRRQADQIALGLRTQLTPSSQLAACEAGQFR
ncbi:hypothetical protein [Nonomuraea guangzhouensis]|uniref:Uncharacterized protein n=1 Tax=Nonomuraea guangzhouensis TaxID=1291555 RepID=A0ABW4GJ79_9ACTN|nr:hypothetical protein [Nonomuraea guangzhouensis]